MDFRCLATTMPQLCFVRPVEKELQRLVEMTADGKLCEIEVDFGGIQRQITCAGHFMPNFGQPELWIIGWGND